MIKSRQKLSTFQNDKSQYRGELLQKQVENARFVHYMLQICSYYSLSILLQNSYAASFNGTNRLCSLWNGLISNMELGIQLYLWSIYLFRVHECDVLKFIRHLNVCLLYSPFLCCGLACLTSHFQHLVFANSSFSNCLMCAYFPKHRKRKYGKFWRVNCFTKFFVHIKWRLSCPCVSHCPTPCFFV